MDKSNNSASIRLILLFLVGVYWRTSPEFEVGTSGIIVQKLKIGLLLAKSSNS